ncbi:hypothetical protein BsWGS_03083 [Bradybaena similaris]
MKSALKFLNINQRSRWSKANYCPLVPTCSGSRRNITIPSLTHLAAARTLSAFVPKTTYYEVLGLTPSATAADIRQAFLKLSKQCHPDVVSGGYDTENHKRFVQVNEAYSVLSRPLSRRNYDATLNTSQAYTTTAPPHGYHQPDAEPYTHYNYRYKGQQSGSDWTKAHSQTGGKVFTHFILVTSCLTCAAVALILHYTHYYIPDPKFLTLRKSNRLDIEQHELIMTSEHEGTVVYYYAVPKANDSNSYEVLAVMKNPIKDSDMPEIQELNRLDYNRKQAL